MGALSGFQACHCFAVFQGGGVERTTLIGPADYPLGSLILIGRQTIVNLCQPIIIRREIYTYMFVLLAFEFIWILLLISPK